MNIHHVVIFCFLSALCGGNSGLVSANPPVFTGPEGGSGTITCTFTVSGSWRFFCKEECKEEDVLIRTDGVRANSGRYSINYKKKRSSGGGILSVTIKHLTQSDSGWYRCGLGESTVPDTFQDFEVRVSDGLLDKNSGFIRTNIEGDNLTYPCRDSVNRSRTFFCRGDCKKQEDILIETDEDSAQRGRYGIKYIEGSVFGLYATITQVVKSDSGQYRCGYGRALSPDSYHTFSVIVDAPSTLKPSRTLRPFSTAVPSTFTPSPVFSETTNQPTAAVPSTSTPTTTQSLSSSSGSSTTSPDFPETTNQPTTADFSHVPHPTSSYVPSYFMPVVVCVPLAGVLLLVAFLLLHYIQKTRKNKQQKH
ncbi:polymeric immunoglobulin receptor-like isoform X2 [Trachinotus anak]|uniref:polymeric immunoglobulin receptor-like isoform X2 n=1 Tax=Trachinotus anak TaxID=443729 RepID=UPI0039F1BD40